MVIKIVSRVKNTGLKLQFYWQLRHSPSSLLLKGVVVSSLLLDMYCPCMGHGNYQALQ